MHTTVILESPIGAEAEHKVVSVAHDGVDLVSTAYADEAALEAMVEHFLECHGMVDASEAHVVFTSSSTLRGLLEGAALANVTVRPVVTGAALQATWAACAAAHSATRHAFYEAERAEEAKAPTKLIIATDASMNPRRHLAGIGLVTSNGGVHQTTVAVDTIYEAECYAIYKALKGFGRRADQLVIQTDNRHAFLNLGPRSETHRFKPNSYGHWAQQRLAQLRREGVSIRIEWVRGHNGHPLNELADRTAVWARRNAEWDLREQRAEFLERIKGELQATLAEETTREELALVA